MFCYSGPNIPRQGETSTIHKWVVERDPHGREDRISSLQPNSICPHTQISVQFGTAGLHFCPKMGIVIATGLFDSGEKILGSAPYKHYSSGHVVGVRQCDVVSSFSLSK